MDKIKWIATTSCVRRIKFPTVKIIALELHFTNNVHVQDSQNSEITLKPRCFLINIYLLGGNCSGPPPEKGITNGLSPDRREPAEWLGRG